MSNDPYSLNLPEDHAFYAAVVSDGKALSGSWRFWSNRDDIYVGVTPLREEFKTSLHQSGNFRHAFTSKHIAEKVLGKGVDRAIDSWKKPAPTPEGVTWLLQIVIPGACLGVAPDHSLPEASHHLPMPGADEVLIVGLLFMPPELLGKKIKFDGAHLLVIDSWTLRNGTLVAIVCYIRPLPDILRRFMMGLSPAIAEGRKGVDSSKPGEHRFIQEIILSDGDARVTLDCQLDALEKWIASQGAD